MGVNTLIFPGWKLYIFQVFLDGNSMMICSEYWKTNEWNHDLKFCENTEIQNSIVKSLGESMNFHEWKFGFFKEI